MSCAATTAAMGASVAPPERAQPVSSTLGFRDHLGTVRVRLGFGRMDYMVAPGLYAIGHPAADSLVFVTANFKLTFDRVRRALRGMSAWLLVLDTQGINVWCAAGKGTFSTAELCQRIAQTGLAQVVSHRRIILPQLGAVGVAAHEVATTTGFTVVYGPVRAEDISTWLAAGRRKSPAMRTVRFNLLDRVVLVPVELHGVRPYAPALLALAVVLALIRGRGLTPVVPTLISGYFVAIFGAVALSAFLVACVLPVLPGRSFSLKGAVIGLGMAAAMAGLASTDSSAWLVAAFRGGFTAAGATLATVAIAAFVALNFTGTTVFTSQSGTLLETKKALPVIVTAGAGGLVLQVVGAVLGEPL